MGDDKTDLETLTSSDGTGVFPLQGSVSGPSATMYRKSLKMSRPFQKIHRKTLCRLNGNSSCVQAISGNLTKSHSRTQYSRKTPEILKDVTIRHQARLWSPVSRIPYRELAESVDRPLNERNSRSNCTKKATPNCGELSVVLMKT